MIFNEYLDKKEERHHDVLRIVHDQFLASHPGIRLERKWGLPVFMLRKNIAYLDVQKGRPLLGIMYAKDIPAMKNLLEIGNRKQVGHFYLDNMNDNRFAELLAVIEIAISHDLAR